MYALNLDTDNRILSATFEEYASADSIIEAEESTEEVEASEE